MHLRPWKYKFWGWRASSWTRSPWKISSVGRISWGWRRFSLRSRRDWCTKEQTGFSSELKDAAVPGGGKELQRGTSGRSIMSAYSDESTVSCNFGHLSTFKKSNKSQHRAQNTGRNDKVWLYCWEQLVKTGERISTYATTIQNYSIRSYRWIFSSSVSIRSKRTN